MTRTFVAACIQNCAEDHTPRSVAQCVSLIRQAHQQGADLICLPEFCSHLHVDGQLFKTGAQKEPDHVALDTFRALASTMKVWILVGSIAVIDQDNHHRNRSYLINDQGEIVVRYDKIHMFDVTLSNGEVYRESATFRPGEQAIVSDTPFGTLGLSVCYDLRFPALYRLLAQNGASVLTVPAAFTYTTGQVHWQVLLRSRAIETGSFVLAPCQYGVHGKARTYGHSLIIDPWGQILAEGVEDGPDVILAELDLTKVNEARFRIPALEHDRIFTLE